MSIVNSSEQSRSEWDGPVASPLDDAAWNAWVAKGHAQDERRRAALIKAAKWVVGAGLVGAAGLWSHLAPFEAMVRFIVPAAAIAMMYELFRARAGRARSAAAITSLLVFGAISTAAAADLSKYRDMQLGTDLATVAKQTGTIAAQAKVIHRRPALIQDLEWRPQLLGPTAQTEPAKEVVFSFYNGELFRIVVSYDRYETEGMTADDMVAAISATYGTAAKIPVQAKSAQDSYGDQEEVLARWQDPQYRFDLIRYSYGPSFRLVGVLKKLEAPAQAAVVEAARLDELEAPQRDAARLASDEEAAKVTLEKARLVNKPKFRP